MKTAAGLLAVIGSTIIAMIFGLRAADASNVRALLEARNGEQVASILTDLDKLQKQNELQFPEFQSPELANTAEVKWPAPSTGSSATEPGVDLALPVAPFEDSPEFEAWRKRQVSRRTVHRDYEFFVDHYIQLSRNEQFLTKELLAQLIETEGPPVGEEGWRPRTPLEEDKIQNLQSDIARLLGEDVTAVVELLELRSAMMYVGENKGWDGLMSYFGEPMTHEVRIKLARIMKEKGLLTKEGGLAALHGPVDRETGLSPFVAVVLAEASGILSEKQKRAIRLWNDVQVQFVNSSR